MNDQKKVLIVDDNPSLCDALEFKLNKEGFSTDVAHTGEEGLVQIEAFAPDLVLLDITMPQLSGLELLMRFNRQPHSKKTKFIILTNHVDTKTLSDVFMYEVTDFIDKAATPIENVVTLVKQRLNV